VLSGSFPVRAVLSEPPTKEETMSTTITIPVPLVPHAADIPPDRGRGAKYCSDACRKDCNNAAMYRRRKSKAA
jgi:hypothetical protein